MISKTHISAQKPRGRQLNTKVCGSENAIFLLSLFRPLSQTTISRKRFKLSPSFYHETDAYHSAELYNHALSVFIATNSSWLIKLFSALPTCCLLRRTPFSNVVRMRTRSLVPKPKTTVIGLGARLLHT